MQNETVMQNKILVIGDWLVDEHWITGIHRSPTSSRTGQAHYRTLQLPTSTIHSLCGAGHTASILHHAKHGPENKDKFCDIIGVGLWHKEDSGILAGMLNIDGENVIVPHRITIKPKADSSTKPEANSSAKNNLFNLGDSLKDKEGKYGTTKIIRVYQHTGNKIDLIQRIDWELPYPVNGWFSKSENSNKLPAEGSNLSKYLEEHKKEFKAVVIKDMCKGVISKELIQWLVGKPDEKGKLDEKIPWFISTKAWRPNWLEELKDVDVRLLIIPQVAAQHAVREGDLSRWITRSKHVSKEALEKIDYFYDLLNVFERLVVVTLPEGSSVLARDKWHENQKKDKDKKDKDKKDGIMQTDLELAKIPVVLPMASVFFPALVANLLEEKNMDFKKLLRDSLCFTKKWMLYEILRMKNPETWSPKGEKDEKGDIIPSPRLELDDAKGAQNKEVVCGTWQTFPWESTKKDWDSAVTSYGIIGEKKNGEKNEENMRLELWRAMTDVEGYICCVKSKRKVIQKLVKELEGFNANGRRQHKSYMLIASPGSGKTFLIDCLAKSLGLRPLSFNITQMLSKSDILDCFDTIVTTQAQDRKESLLVFFDEINATLQGQHVYDTFLAPLEEGVYVRAGKTFHIDPCIWFFAGTEGPAEGNDKDKSAKADDFESRLSLAPLKLTKSRSEEGDEARLENVYLGVSLLRSIFPDVRKVSQKVLRTFHSLRPELEIRELKHFVKSFVDIQYGKVLGRNVSLDWLREFRHQEIDISDWENWPEDSEVDID
ncbi:MAG: AAA family ATPase [Gammaproteobacteria bacterium]|nr:AAA family ATPase [Gammaproteobacteria bacterium]